MKIPLEFYELIRNRINLSDVIRQKVILTKKSNNYVGLCPFHVEKSPSFTVNDVKKFYYCFGCSSHGDVIKFTAHLNGMSYKESAIKLAGEYGIELPKLTKKQKDFYEESDKIFNILHMASEFFSSQLYLDHSSISSQEILNYLTRRSINKDMIEEFSIGFAPSGKKLQKFFTEKGISLVKLEKAGLVVKKENGIIYEIFYDRIIFPIRNIYNKIVGFGGRVIDNGLPKYLNSPETIIFQKNETLYGEHKAISASYKKNYSILVEGYLDVIALHKAGFNEAVASLGTAVTDNHLQKLWRAGDEIIVCLDGDMAGKKATIKIINLALKLINSNKKISFIRLQKDSDPDEIVNNSTIFFADLLNKRISLSEMIWYIEYDGKSFVTAEDKACLEKSLENYCEQITDKVLSNNYYRFFKNQLWQNLIKYKNSVVKRSSDIVCSSPNYSEIEMLEYVFCVILLKFSEMLKEEKIKDFLLTLNFQNQMLGSFRDWYFEEIINNNLLNEENITQIIKNTRFYNIFLVLSKPNNLFLDISLYKNSHNLDLFWSWLQKKYHLVLLKQEYTSIIQNSCFNEEFKKAILYKEEILKVSKELQELNY